MKLLAALVALVGLAGCAGPCQDGMKPSLESRLLWGIAASDSYAECSHKCCRAKKPKECACSEKCSCEHGKAAQQ
jgi:hypothetical protein